MVNKSTVNKGEFHKILRAKMFRSVLILGHETNSFRDAETSVFLTLQASAFSLANTIFGFGKIQDGGSKMA